MEMKTTDVLTTEEIAGLERIYHATNLLTHKENVLRLIATIRQRDEQLRQAERVSQLAQELVAALNRCHASAEYMRVWEIAQAHHGTYSGPVYTHELEQLKAALNSEPTEEGYTEIEIDGLLYKYRYHDGQLVVYQRQSGGQWAMQGVGGYYHTIVRVVLAFTRTLRSDYDASCREMKHWMEYVDRTAKELGLPAGLASWEFMEQVCIVADERDKFRATLEVITNPLKYLQERADSEGETLNGLAATYVADSPEFLKGIARDALAGKS